MTLLVSANVIAQEKTVSGTVKDEKNEPIPLAYVIVKGTDKGTQTDFDGNFSLSVPNDATTLLISIVGFTTKEVSISSGNIDVSMEATTNELEAVTVTAGRRSERVLDAPASVSTIEQKQIRHLVAATPTDYLSNTSGVDIVKAGLTSTNIVIRGFNNVFSGAVLSLVDNRIASVPSLRVSAQQMIPASVFDIQRIEVLKGPASAMYGPNSANGVVHIITESPLDMDKQFKTTVALGGGIRAKQSSEEINYDIAANTKPLVFDDGSRYAMTGIIRHAGKLKENRDGLSIGYKVSAKYFGGFDWMYNDPFELGITLDPNKVAFEGVSNNAFANYIALNRQTANGTVYGDTTGTAQVVTSEGDTLTVPQIKGTITENKRENEIKNYNFEGRVDFRFNRGMQLIFAGGQNSFTGIEMTGLGAGQGKNWKYAYGQARFIWKDLFVQAYINSSNSGDTYLYRSGNKIVDKSKFISAQIQHGLHLAKDRLNFIYGFDALLTRPNTESTINGRNEDKDNIDEIGGYVQGDFKVTPKLSLIAAIRADKHTFVKDVFLSPRAAIVYKPNFNNSFRATFNRAFSSPSALSTSLDIESGALPTFIDVRASGNRAGFNFSFDDAGLPQYRASSLFTNLIGASSSDYFNLNSDQMNNTVYNFVVGRLAAGLKETAASINPALIPLIDSTVANVIPSSITGVLNDLRKLDLNTSSFPTTMSPSAIKNIPAVKNSVTQTYEVGYKGIIKNKLSLTADVYYTQIKDFQTPLVLVTPNVFINPTSLYGALVNQLVANAQNPANLPYISLLTAALDTAKIVQGLDISGDMDLSTGQVNAEGDDKSGLDELLRLLISGTAQVPFGTISPTLASDPSMFLTYFNAGNIDLFGAELGLTYILNENFKVGTNYAFSSDDQFEYISGLDTFAVALNAPKHKFGVSGNYTIANAGLDIGLKYRWQDAFPVNSGVYVGTVNATNLVDLSLGYSLPFSKQTQLSLSIQNVLNHKHNEIIGAPKIGRFTMFQISHTF